MPKAEATTGLAPKKASATNPLLLVKPAAEGFVFRNQSLSLVKSRRSGGHWAIKREVRRALFARRSSCLLPINRGRRRSGYGRSGQLATAAGWVSAAISPCSIDWLGQGASVGAHGELWVA